MSPKKTQTRSKYSALEEFSWAVREAYINQMHHRETILKGTHQWRPGAWWDGGVVKGQRRCNIWIKAAEFIFRHQLPLIEYVNFVVMYWTDRPAPNHLCSPKAAKAFHSSEVGRDQLAQQQIALALDHQEYMLHEALDRYEEYSEFGWVPKDPKKILWMILADEKIELTALFRYCSAATEGFDDLVKKFNFPALAQYLTDCDEYDEIWGDWIPEKFRRVKQNMQRLLKQGERLHE